MECPIHMLTDEACDESCERQRRQWPRLCDELWKYQNAMLILPEPKWSPATEIPSICRVCGGPIPLRHRPNKVYCSATCRMRWCRALRRVA